MRGGDLAARTRSPEGQSRQSAQRCQAPLRALSVGISASWNNNSGHSGSGVAGLGGSGDGRGQNELSHVEVSEEGAHSQESSVENSFP